MDSISSEVISRLSEFVAQNLSNTAWAYSALGVRDEPLLESLAAQAIASITALRERDIAAIAWSFATIGLPNTTLLDALAAQSSSRITEFEPRSLANLAWSFSTLAYGDTTLLSAISAAVLRKISLASCLGTDGNPGFDQDDARLEDFVTNLKAVAWASNFAGLLTD